MSNVFDMDDMEMFDMELHVKRIWHGNSMSNLTLAFFKRFKNSLTWKFHVKSETHAFRNSIWHGDSMSNLQRRNSIWHGISMSNVIFPVDMEIPCQIGADHPENLSSWKRKAPLEFAKASPWPTAPNEFDKASPWPTAAFWSLQTNCWSLLENLLL